MTEHTDETVNWDHYLLATLNVSEEQQDGFDEIATAAELRYLGPASAVTIPTVDEARDQPASPHISP